MLAFYFACTPPDPDALLREGRVDEAIAAYAAASGRFIPSGHPTAQSLAKRAQSESWITVAELVRWTEAAALLEGVPATRTLPLDVSFEAWATMAACTAGRLEGPWRVAVGRSEGPDDPDPNEAGRPGEGVAYAKGRVVGSAISVRPGSEGEGRAALADLFGHLDRDPPAHLVTIVLADAADSLSVNLTRRDGVWWTLSANDAEAGAAWILACGSAA
ncbi:MAG: hypothetical protein EXR71_14250 [Myxococcales bacterium]|nr:hypothetical protein [Myxococcales bacterium]